MSWKRITKPRLHSVGILQRCRTAGNPLLSWSSSLQKIGLDCCAPRGQRQRMGDAAGREAGMEKGMARSRVQHPQEPALNCGAVSEKACLCVLCRVVSTAPAHSLQCALKFSKLAELVCSWNPVENLGEACPLSRSSLTSSTSSPPLALLKHQPHRGCLHGCLCACRCVHAGLSCPSCLSLSVVCLSICTLICKTIYFC